MPITKEQFTLLGSVGGSWLKGHKCPLGQIYPDGTFFQGSYGYSLEEAKGKCARACDDLEECFFADLYYTSGKQTCYLKSNKCGSWQTNTHSAYHLYTKGT